MNIQLLRKHIFDYKKWVQANKAQSNQEQAEHANLSLKYQAVIT
jgi:hypothetical protein